MVSMIALGGPKLKHKLRELRTALNDVSMIALGGPKLKPDKTKVYNAAQDSFNDSTGWA